MKLDKDTLVKYKFWVILAAAAPLSLITILLLVTVVSGQISSQRKKIETDAKSAGGGTAYSQQQIEERQKAANEEAGKRSGIWTKAFSEQQHIFEWADEFEEAFAFNSGYFAKEIKVLKDSPFAANDAKTFHGKIEKIDKLNRTYIDVVDDRDPKKVERKRFRPMGNSDVTEEGAKDKRPFKTLNEGEKVAITFVQYRDFGTPLTDQETDGYVKSYKRQKQLQDIIAQINPATEDGEGVVMLGGSPLKRLDEKTLAIPTGTKAFRFIADWRGRGDISEDIWLAQEDLWIQRELFRRIKLANESISGFNLIAVGQKKLDQPPEKPLAFKEMVDLSKNQFGKPFLFENPYWRIELILQPDQKLRYRIENMLPRRQKLSVSFQAHLNDTLGKEKITIEGVPLDPRPEGLKEGFKEDESPKTKYFAKGVIDVTAKSGPRNGIYGLEQILTSDTAAIKRVELVSIGDPTPDECSHSNRTFPEKLRAFKDDKGEKKEVVEQPREDGGQVVPEIKKGPAEIKKTENQQIRERYLGEAPPGESAARRIPVAIVLIVDQEQIDRVLTSFRNSPLRFLMTQVLINRFGQSPQGLGGQGPVMQPRDPRLPPLILQPQFQPQPMPEAQPAQQQQESNMELVIYGVVTLYNRPRDQAPAQP